MHKNAYPTPKHKYKKMVPHEHIRSVSLSSLFDKSFPRTTSIKTTLSDVSVRHKTDKREVKGEGYRIAGLKYNKNKLKC